MVVEGIGSFGIVLSSPRIPLEDENYDDIQNLNQVSKLLYSFDNKNKYHPATFEDIVLAYDNLIYVIEKYPNIFTNNHFMLPITGGYINKPKFSKIFNSTNTAYGFEWLSKSKTNFQILYQMIIHKNKLFQIVYEKGTRIEMDFNTFILKMSNPLDALINSSSNGFYFDDLKLHNLILHNEDIKIIDFEEPINLNLPDNEYIEIILNSKFNSIMYYPYDAISNVLLYEFIGEIDKIGNLKKNNYYNLLLVNAYEQSDNIMHKIKFYDTMIEIWKKYSSELFFELDVYDVEISKVETNKKMIRLDVETFEKSIKIIYDGYFLSNMSNFSFRKYFDEKKISGVINDVFCLNKKIIELMTNNNFKDKISYILSKSNIHSFGFMFLEWFCDEVNNILKSDNRKTVIEKIFEIVVKSCLNFILKDEKVYLTITNYYDIEKIIKYKI